MNDGKRLQPALVNEPDEFRIPSLPLYATGFELGIIAFVGIFIYIAMIPIGGIYQAATAGIAVYVVAWWIGKYKEGKPASWLTDLQMAWCFYPNNQSRYLGTRRGIMILSMHHVSSRAPFKNGKAKTGELLIDNHPSLIFSPPGVLRPGLMPPGKKGKILLGKKGTGYWALATEDDPRPVMQVRVEYYEQSPKDRFHG